MDQKQQYLLQLRERRRRLARKDTLAFTRFTFPTYTADKAHGVIAWALDRAIEGGIDRLMIFAPPQHGKSELASVRFPARWLGSRPHDPVIITSYGADLALDKSQQARGVVESDEFHEVFPHVRTDASSRSRELWRLSGWRGSVKAAGVGGPITGRGAALGIIDDPVKDWKDAQSTVQRKGTWEWYRGTFRTRIWENGVIVLIMTRWHQEDLAGMLLQEQPGRWYVLRLPAIAETQDERDFAAEKMGLPLGQPDPVGRAAGQPLCPNRFSIQALLETKDDVGSLVWGAEYQGFPQRMEGNWFKRDWFPIVDEIPDGLKLVRYWDNAATEGAGAFTAGVLLGHQKDTKRVWLLNVVHGQWSTHHRYQVMLQTAEADKARWGSVRTYIEQEPGSAGKDAIEAQLAFLEEYAVYADKVTGDKDTRLLPFHAASEAGRVQLLSGPWVQAWLDEICSLELGGDAPYRDQSDATGGAYNKLAGKRWRKVEFAHLGQGGGYSEAD